MNWLSVNLFETMFQNYINTIERPIYCTELECCNLASCLCLWHLSCTILSSYQKTQGVCQRMTSLCQNRQVIAWLQNSLAGASARKLIFFFQDGEWVSNLFLLLPQGRNPSVLQWSVLPNWVPRISTKIAHHLGENMSC